MHEEQISSCQAWGQEEGEGYIYKRVAQGILVTSVLCLDCGGGDTNLHMQ